MPKKVHSYDRYWFNTTLTKVATHRVRQYLHRTEQDYLRWPKIVAQKVWMIFLRRMNDR